MATHLNEMSTGAAPDKRTSTLDGNQTFSSSTSKQQKLNQVMQNFYSKAAQIIIQARQPVPPLYARGSTTKRLNKWFNIETVDTEAFREELRYWKSLEIMALQASSIKPLVIEVVLLTRDLTPNQTLVFVDEADRRWDIESGANRRKSLPLRIVLERWSIELDQHPIRDIPELPVTYKKSIVVFRSLYALSRILPAWKLRKRLARSKLTGNSLRVVCHIKSDIESADRDHTIDLSSSPIERETSKLKQHSFHAVETPIGRLRVSVDFRTACDFRVDDSEALLSSHFLTSDERGTEFHAGSQPPDSRRRVTRPASSLGNYVRENSYSSSLPQHVSEGRIGTNIISPRSDRRPSAVLIQPFKTPSLSASPLPDPFSRSPRTLARTQSAASVDRLHSRSVGGSNSHRIPSSLGDSVATTGSASPRTATQIQPPLKRYSSSFGQRSSSFSNRRRASQASDLHAIRTSSQSPGAISQMDEADDLGDFVKLLDTRTPLQGSHFQEYGASKDLRDVSKQRTQLQLSRFQDLRDSHWAMHESLVQYPLPRTDESSTSSTKRALPFSTLTSSSPGKSLSPHTPAIPSKLAESTVLPLTAQENNMSVADAAVSPSGPRLFSNVSINDSTVSEQDTESLMLDVAAQNDDFEGGKTSRAFTSHKRDFFAEDPLQHTYASKPESSLVSTSSSSSKQKVEQRRDVKKVPHSSGTNAFLTTRPFFDSNDGPMVTPVHGESPQVDDDDLFFAMSDLHLGFGAEDK